jgi:hypothetical protein
VAVAIVGVVLGPAVQRAAAANGPVITTFGCAESPNNWWLFSGTVTDPNPAGVVVHFGGLPSLNGQSTKCDASGHFAFLVQLQAGEQGTVSAVAINGNGNKSAAAFTNVSP